MASIHEKQTKMKRGNKPNKSNKTELQKWLATLYNVAKYIPDCEDLYDEDQANLWYTGQSSNEYEDIQEIKKLIRRNVNPWLANEDPEVVMEVLHELKVTKKLRPVLLALTGLIRSKYRFYFESDFKGLPRIMSAPTMKFFSIQPQDVHKHRNTITIKNPFGKLEIRGGPMITKDMGTTAALTQMLRYKEIKFLDRSLHYRTSIVEMARTMMISNPHSITVRNRIWSSLERIHACSMTETNSRGLRKLIHILDGAEELDEDSLLEIDIYITKDFIKLFESGYLNIAPDILYKSPNKEIQLLATLKSIPQFNSGLQCHLGCIHQFYNVQSGLGGMTEKDKPYVRFHLKQVLQATKDKGRVKMFSMANDKLTLQAGKVSEHEEKSITTVIKEKEKVFNEKREQELKQMVCPHGMRFGYDCWNGDECNGCNLYTKCNKLQDILLDENGEL